LHISSRETIGLYKEKDPSTPQQRCLFDLACPF